jgi:Mg-chelatase subunit ChlD
MKVSPRLRTAGTVALIFALAACAGGVPGHTAYAGPSGYGGSQWPPAWQDVPPQWDSDEVRFDPPSANHCHRAPTTQQVPGGRWPQLGSSRERSEAAVAEAPAPTELPAAPATESVARTDRAARDAGDESAGKSAGAAGVVTDEALPVPAWREPRQSLRRERPRHAPVTAGMVDDNADFGEYLAYRERNAGLAVRDRDVSERYLLEVTDAAGRPVHDAEVAVQRAGRAEPIAWARTDTAGRVWLHPRAFAAHPAWDRTLGIAVRKGAWQGRAVLVRGQANAVQVRLGGAAVVQRPRLDLVFLIDATGSMGDEIAKLKASMRAIANQIGQLPVQPDVCYGLVAYRDRGDAFVTRTHDFTDDLGAFQSVLGRLQASGGGDKPEALNEALHEVVHRLSWRRDAVRTVVLVADAGPHLDYGGPQYDIDMQAALAKGIKLFTVGASGLEAEGEYVYRQLAQYTAGRFVFLTYRDAANPGSGPGSQTVHDVKNYSVQTLDRLIVKLVSDELGRLARS